MRVKSPLPETFVLIYSPRGECVIRPILFVAQRPSTTGVGQGKNVSLTAETDESDLRVVCKIIEAAIWYTSEERVDLESLLVQSC